MRVAIIGSRETGDFSVERMLSHIPLNTTELVSGGALGVDTIAEEAARRLDLPIRVFLPDYDSNGRLAPLIRNQQIVDYAELVLAFWDNHSHGTAYSLQYCVQTHKPFRIIGLHGSNE